jgi:putative ABC transport system permease protein
LEKRKRVNRENIKIAARAVKSQLLRTVLTVFIIALGITALVGILTSIDALEAKVKSDFSMMGVNTFSIRLPSNSGKRQGGIEGKVYKNINFREAQLFKKTYDYDATVAISAFASFTGTIKYKSEKTNPNVTVMGGDMNYLKISGLEIEYGRNFSKNEDQKGLNVALVGASVLKKLGMEKSTLLNKVISVGGSKYRVIGLIKEKGKALFMDPDNQVIVPVMNVKLNYASQNTNYRINVITKTAEELDDAATAAIGRMRVVRKDVLGEEDSFQIRMSDGFANDLLDFTKSVPAIATFIAIITLLGAAIGLMNIMLVSVTERTKEIGVRKSIGASSRTIRWQFLIEAILIGQLGGLLGLVLGIGIGNAVSIFVGGTFIIPWLWIGMAILLCLVVSIVSGYYPASKAAKLDPIESLRYE